MPTGKQFMVPAFSKIPIAATFGISVLSGLICSHTGCNALSSSMEDTQAHARADHSGKMAANTCRIYERMLENRKIQLYRVLDENGEPMI